MLEGCVLQMSASVSRGGVQLSRGLGNVRGDGARPSGQEDAQAGRSVSEPASLKGLCSMGKHGISAYLTLQLSPMSKVGEEEQEAKCKAIKIINPLIKETSSTCSSDPGLFTNDEGRQGDDEQSDWFFEGDCGVGTSVAGLLPGWDSDGQLDNRPPPTFLQPARPPQRGYRYHSRLKRVPGSAACCMRRDRRRLPSKSQGMPVFVERLRQYSQDPYQRDFWRPPVGKRDRSQLNPLCQLPVCQRAPVSDVLPQSADAGRLSDIRRRTEAVSVTTSASNPFHKDHRREDAQGASNTSTLVGPRAPGPPATTQSNNYVHSSSAAPVSGNTGRMVWSGLWHEASVAARQESIRMFSDPMLLQGSERRPPCVFQQQWRSGAGGEEMQKLLKTGKESRALAYNRRMVALPDHGACMAPRRQPTQGQEPPGDEATFGGSLMKQPPPNPSSTCRAALHFSWASAAPFVDTKLLK
ncbi:hypothetical protein KUCAC02_026094, partial [Chaenocephalus aceratus]